MASYIKLKQTIDKLPLLDKEWFFINPLNIIKSSTFGDVIYNKLSVEDKVRIDFPRVVKETGGYPRFDVTDSVYTIHKNELNILPTTPTNKSITEITDNRSIQLLLHSKHYEKIYIFYSGGLDSTTILSAIVKHWSIVDLEKIYIVLNHHSVDEYPLFYLTYIKDKLKTIDSDLFFSGQIKLTHDNLYVTGDCGSAIFAPSNIVLYDTMFPNTYKLTWKSNKNNIIKYFDYEYAEKVFEKIESSIPDHLTTVYDFLWWCAFNQGYDIDLYYLIGLYCYLDDTIDTRKFLLENTFYWFNELEYQNWVMYSTYDMKIGNTVKLSKLPLRKYILDFTGDLEYYNNKSIEFSVSKNKNLLKRLPIGVDVDYNIYYRDSKWLK